MHAKQNHHLTHGPAFSDHTGKLISSTWIEMEILDRLQEIQRTSPDLIQPNLDVHEESGISRSFCRGVTTEASNKGVRENDIDAMSRWRTAEQATSFLEGSIIIHG